MDFKVYPLRFRFVALNEIHFPSGKSGNTLRGAFGLSVMEVGAPVYERLFEPTAMGESPSGFADPVRPFVFRTRHLDGARVKPGGHFAAGFNLFDTTEAALADLRQVLVELGKAGMGPGRGRAELLDVEYLAGAQAGRPLQLSLDQVESAVTRVRVRVGFLTPTELKTEGGLAERPEFGVLMARIRDRVSNLRSRYQGGPLEIDFRGFGGRAARVGMTRCETEWVQVVRRSSRTGQTHPIGGFSGVAEYDGELGEFVPFLKAAEWTGVGRQTSWGKGELAVEVL